MMSLDCNVVREALKDYDAPRFEQWIRVGLEGLHRDGLDRWAFDPLGLYIGLCDTVADDLTEVYRCLVSTQQSAFRKGVANVFAVLAPTSDNAPIFEELLWLTRALEAYEVLGILAARLQDARLAAIAVHDGEDLFSVALNVVAGLAARRADDDVLICLQRLVEPDHFPERRSGIALRAMARAAPDQVAQHVRLLRTKLFRFFANSPVGGELQLDIARDLWLIIQAGGVFRAVTGLIANGQPVTLDDDDLWLVDAWRGCGAIVGRRGSYSVMPFGDPKSGGMEIPSFSGAAMSESATSQYDVPVIDSLEELADDTSEAVDDLQEAAQAADALGFNS